MALKISETNCSRSHAPSTAIPQVGKGITYDTGGADIKAGGVMAGREIV